ncbi:hypothetical protein PUN28_001557 [Cardiocondyla obscurior]|uniref:Uncharacterized protein n=1 Tax=Cardiocondyla obscurior TaxID=286306 RepID=A0AAW2H5P4_9HYME
MLQAVTEIDKSQPTTARMHTLIIEPRFRIIASRDRDVISWLSYLRLCIIRTYRVQTLYTIWKLDKLCTFHYILDLFAKIYL